MRPNDPLRDRQTKSGTCGRTAAFQPVKPLEDTIALLGGNPRTVVSHLEMKVIASSRKPNLHVASRIAVAKRVVDQDYKDLTKPVAVHRCLN